MLFDLPSHSSSFGLSLAFSPVSQRNNIFEAGAVIHYWKCPAHWVPHLFKASWHFTAHADRAAVSKYLHEVAAIKSWGKHWSPEQKERTFLPRQGHEYPDSDSQKLRKTRTETRELLHQKIRSRQNEKDLKAAINGTYVNTGIKRISIREFCSFHKGAQGGINCNKSRWINMLPIRISTLS